jgi:hypothetical protein
MKKILWFLLEKFDNNWGYTTPLQKRFKIGDIVKISHFKLYATQLEFGEQVTILETGRHDYLVENSKGVKAVVYQFELKSL